MTNQKVKYWFAIDRKVGDVVFKVPRQNAKGYRNQGELDRWMHEYQNRLGFDLWITTAYSKGEAEKLWAIESKQKVTPYTGELTSKLRIG